MGAAQRAFYFSFHSGMHVHEGTDLRDGRLACWDCHGQDLHVVPRDTPLLATGRMGNLRRKWWFVPDKVGFQRIKDIFFFLRERNNLCCEIRAHILLIFDGHRGDGF